MKTKRIEKYYGCFFSEGADGRSERVVEHDNVPVDKAKAWFTESFRHHVGKLPSERRTRMFMGQETVTARRGGLSMRWEIGFTMLSESKKRKNGNVPKPKADK